ncbi:SseB family protein [Weissella coleopterorum]|uniref:SseB family protein n=1 Tax=Weissella coleopterorum TaxID=2714949 RepID=A0A6G8AZ44_9LACO|nr:SseB family protein [Weissella coleopterorum]QIL50276.1 SseB family protein [Weissella coleopterorum]
MTVINLDNTELKTAFANFKTVQTPELQTQFELALLNAHFLVPVQAPENLVPDAEGNLNLAAGQQLAFVSLIDPNEENFLPIFTDNENYQKNPDHWEQNIMVVEFPFTQFIEMFKKDATLQNLVMNPFISQETLQISRDNIEYLMQNYEYHQGEPQPIQNMMENSEPGTDQAIEIRVPDEVPTKLQANLMGLADDAKGIVDKMYLLWMQGAGGRQGRFLLLLDGPDLGQVKDQIPNFKDVFPKTLGEKITGEVVLTQEIAGLDLSEFQAFYQYQM